MRKLVFLALLLVAGVARADMIGASGGGSSIPNPPYIGNFIHASNTSAVAASSQPYSQAIWVPTTVTVTGFRLGVGVTGSGNIDIAVYTQNYGTQLIHLGSTVANAGVNNYNLGSSVVLAPGVYQLVMTGSTSVAMTFQRDSGNTSNINCLTDSTDPALPLNASYTAGNFSPTALCFQIGMLVSGGVTQ